MSALAPTRFTASNPCPVCGGYPAMPRHQGIRCVGFITDQGYIHCTREEHAGGLEPSSAAVPTFAHIDREDCRCGLPHVRYGAHQLATRAIPTPTRRIVRRRSWEIKAPDGTLLGRHWRHDYSDGGKEYPWQRPDGAWTQPAGGIAAVLYGAELVPPADPEWAVMATEGEKSADALRDFGVGKVVVVATVCGAPAAVSSEAFEVCRGRRVYLWPDYDDAGAAHMRQVADALVGIAAEVRLIHWGERVKDDAADFVERGGTHAELAELVKTALPIEAAVPPSAQAIGHEPNPATGDALGTPRSTEVRPEPVAAPPPQDTSTLLDEVRAFLSRFLVLPGEHFYDAMALFVLHSHALDAADTSPRLILKSPEKESGKTRALEVLELLVPAPLAVMNATTAAIFRLLAEEQATVLFDEVDAIFGSKAGNYEDLRALLNAGYRRGATVARVVGEGKKMRTERFQVFAATALAAIGDLPDTIESRAIIIPMRRRAPGEQVDPFRRRRVVQDVADVRARLTEWAATSTPSLTNAEPEMPEQLEDRAADIWEPLLAIADLAGAEWATRGRDAAIHVVKGRVADDASIGVRLLADIQTVFASHDRMSSAALCIGLNAMAESGWAGWNADKGINQRDLAKRLKGFGIGSKVLRLPDNTTPRGYMRADLSDAFARYLRVPPPISGATRATSATPIRIHVADVADVALGSRDGVAEQSSGTRVY
jgi:hypothetical protein